MNACETDLGFPREKAGRLQLRPRLPNLPCLTLLASLILLRADAQVPGAVYTVSGYDNTDGEDAICWSAPAFHNHTLAGEFLEEVEGHDEEHLDTDDFNGINWQSELVPSFVAGPTTMLPSCPSGTTVHVDILPELVHGSHRLRTKRLYTYHVTGKVNLEAIREQYELSDTSFFYSSDGLNDIGLRIEFCPVNGNLCSPFALERGGGDTLGGHIHHEGDDHDNYHGAHDDDHHDGDHEHKHGEDHGVHRVRRMGAQLVAFNITFDEPENDEDHEHEEDDDALEGGPDHEHEEDHDELQGEKHHGQDEDHHGDHDEDNGGHGEHDEDASHDHGHEDEDGNEAHEHDDHERETDKHGHDYGHDDHEGHSLETGESHLKHLSSPLFLIPVNITNETEFEFHIDVDVEVVLPGNYLRLASLQFFLSNDTIHGHAVGIDSEAALKFDVANLLHQRAVFYYDKAYIQTASLSIEIVSYVVIGIAGIAQFFCLCATWLYRNNAVMKLSQGSFLMLLQGAGIMATACSFLYNPKSDAYCILQSPMTLIPLQFMFAIVFGRLRRIISIMEPLLNWNAPQSRREAKSGLKTWRATFMNGRASWRSSSKDGSKASRGSKASSQSSRAGEETEEAHQPSMKRGMFWNRNAFCRSNVRQQYTARRLWLLIILVTLPIVIVEIVGLALFLPELVLDMNADESIGTFECGTQEEQTYFLSTTAVLLFTLFLCVCEAQRSRRLPGLFNEAASVSFALLSSLFVSGLGVAVVITSTDANARYLMEVILVTYVASILVIRLTLPKLRLIWRGEKVVLGQMLSEHRKASEPSNVESSTTRNCLSGLSADSQKYESLDKLEGGSMDPVNSENSPAADRAVTFDDQTTKRVSETSLVSHTERPSVQPLVIRLGEAPPDRLTFRVLNHSNVMSRVIERILSGLQVGRDDWERVKASLDELSGLLDTAEYR